MQRYILRLISAARSPIVLIAILCLSANAALAQPAETRSRDRLILAHYMPWYVAKPHSPVWGWHWTMNHFDPEEIVDGRRSIASHYDPLIGPYDSGDPAVLEYHLLLMKLAGIDGVIVDWYGRQDFNDYPILHANTQKLARQINRFGMKFVVCYEDQTIPKLVAGGRVAAADRVNHAVEEIDWLTDHWFALDSYVRLDEKPVLLSFGHAGLTNDEWTQCLSRLKPPVSYFSEHFRRDGAVGGFDWPIPSKGIAATGEFLKSSRNWPCSIPVAFPRFVDVYKAAQLHDGFGRVDDERGATFRSTLQRALASEAKLIQIATWNDWGEGTMIEPSREFGYRDLEFVQTMRRTHIDAEFAASPSDLQLPRRLLQQRRMIAGKAGAKQLDRIATMIAQGNTAMARSMLAAAERSTGGNRQ